MVNDVPDLVTPMVPATFAILGEPLGNAYIIWRDGRDVADPFCAGNISEYRPRAKRLPRKSETV